MENKALTIEERALNYEKGLTHDYHRPAEHFAAGYSQKQAEFIKLIEQEIAEIDQQLSVEKYVSGKIHLNQRRQALTDLLTKYQAPSTIN